MVNSWTASVPNSISKFTLKSTPLEGFSMRREELIKPSKLDQIAEETVQ